MQCPWLARTSKALGDDRTVDKDATSDSTGDIATIQDHPVIQQESDEVGKDTATPKGSSNHEPRQRAALELECLYLCVKKSPLF